MTNKSIEKIGLICLGLASLALAGCFHIPDEDWLPSRNKVNTGNVEKNDEVDQAINSLLDGFNMISSELDNATDEENKLEIEEVSAEELEEPIIVVEDEMVNNEEMVYDEEIINNENQETEENINSEE